MQNSIDSYDAVIIGGGFYGCEIACHLSTKHNFKKICIVEKEAALFSRASTNNQYRVHNGYHYPRSFNTANRSRINYQKFILDWSPAIISNFDSLYAIPKQNSKINSNQFKKFVNSIGAPIKEASTNQKKLFNINYFEDIFQTQECCFSPSVLKNLSKFKLEQLKINLMFSTKVASITNISNSYEIEIENEFSVNKKIRSSFIFNCAYSGLNQIFGDIIGPKLRLKHEIVELAFFKSPKELSGTAITIMDGPFFSILPTEKRNILSLSHVRYTPHLSWRDEKNVDPYYVLNEYDKHSHFNRMYRAAQKWIPSITEESYIDSKFEIKTLLEKNEVDDGRPILFERDENLKNVFYILGSKIDNIYDALEKIDEEL